MSSRIDPVRVVEQLDLDGRVSVVELHGLGDRTRANVLHGLTPEAAARALQESRVMGAEIITGQASRLERPCPKCGSAGDAREVFGFRSVRGRRIRQSWCRACRAR